jgi:Serine aminopeptidase, S33
MRASNERTFRAFDGTELFYRHWPAASSPSRGTIVLFHRGHEHSGRMAHLADELGLDDFAFYAWDARVFEDLAGDRYTIAEFDDAMQRSTPGRSLPDRCRGAKRLVIILAALTAAQALVLLSPRA